MLFNTGYTNSCPTYELGDNIKYPNGSPIPGVLKLYSEGYISNIAQQIQLIKETSDTYTTQEMGAALLGVGYNEKMTLSFPSSMIDATWRCEAAASAEYPEVYTGVVDDTLSIIINLKQPATEYTISCSDTTISYTTGGFGACNITTAALIIPSMTSIVMYSNDQTDGYGVRYITTASHTYKGSPHNPLYRSTDYFNNTWFLGTPRQNGWWQLEVSIPCKVLQFTLYSSFDIMKMTYLIQGSNDGESWDTIRSITTVGDATDYTTKTIDIQPTIAYTHYRIYFLDFTGSHPDSLPEIRDIIFTKVTA